MSGTGKSNKSRNPSNSSEGESTGGARKEGLTWVENFLSERYMSQPAWLRAFTYLVFVLLAALLIYHTSAGHYIVSGRVLESVAGAKEAGRNYDVRVGTEFFGTNSKGIYYVILDAADYASAMASGSLSLEVLKGDVIVQPEGPVKLSRSAQMLADTVATPSQQNAAPQSGRLRARPNPGLLWAASLGGGRRLLLYGIRLQPGADDLKDADVQLETGGRSAALLATRTGGKPAGTVPLLVGDSVRYGADYFFMLDSGNVPPSSLLRLSSRSSSVFARAAQSLGLAGYEETFILPAGLQEGRLVTIKGNKGSEVQVVLSLGYEVVLFSKGDLGQSSDDLKTKLVQNGFWVRDKLAPLGSGETNALFAGKAVPFAAVQSVLKVAMEQGLALKTVQYRLDLKSGNPNEIQLGESVQCGRAVTIPPEAIRQLIDAKTETEFRRFGDQWQACATTPARRPVPAKKHR